MATKYLYVYLSPSNQAHNQYWGGLGSERTIMNRVADALQKELKARGHRVLRGGLTATLSSKVAQANAAKVQLYLAIHSNAGGGRGVEVWIKPGATNGRRFAQAILKRIMEIYTGPNRGIKTRSDWVEIKGPNAPVAYLELPFHDNKQDATWIVNNVDKIAHKLAQAIDDYAGISTGTQTYPTLRKGMSGSAVTVLQFSPHARG